jgi:hypothetical protein
MTTRVRALGLVAALAASALGGACGDDDKPAAVDGGGGGGDSSVPGTDGSITVGNDGSITLGNDGSVIPGTDGGGVLTDGGVVVQPGSDTKLITSVGGSVTSADGRLTVTFGPDTFRRPTTVSVKLLTPAPEGALGPVYDIQPAAEPFADGKNAVVKLGFVAADLNGGSPAELLVGRRSLGRWEPLTNVPTATTANAVAAQITGLGPVALLPGLCTTCETTCAEPCTVEGVAGKCIAYGNGCGTCVPACDTDNDGYCKVASGGRAADCASDDPNRYPGATEICNGIDDDCDNHVDEGCTACTSDAECKPAETSEVCLKGFCQPCNLNCSAETCNFDGPTPGTRVAGTCIPLAGGCALCVPPCDLDGDEFCETDTDPKRVDCAPMNRYVYPGAPEVCNNDLDDDCDGIKNDNCSLCTKDTDCAGTNLACVGGACVSCENACDPNTCQVNGVKGRCAMFGNGCSRCVALCDGDGDGSCAGNEDIDDANPAIGRNLPELCGNGIDDNSNGVKDEGCTACAADSECKLGGQACEKGVCNLCAEQCDMNQCRFGRVEGPVPVAGIAGTCFAYGNGCSKCRPTCDLDGDGFCPPTAATIPANGIEFTDTNDGDATIYPEAPELCDTKDNNLDGVVDEGCLTCANDMMCGTPGDCSRTLPKQND